MSFEVAVKKFLKIKAPGWSAKYATGFERTFELHVTPIIGRLDIAEIETPDILRVIEPLWLTKNDTAEVVRYALTAPELFEAAPRVKAWLAGCHARPAFKAMWAKREAEPA